MSFDTQSISDFSQQAYLNYAMYVIMDRALPHITDGLKPVQRRIIYAMSELGLTAQTKPKKSARTVGDVLGKYHPHGDSACYEAMVLMAQPFSYRYPLICGQGNWGSPDDPKSFAAMRYTEAKMSLYAQSLLQELGAGTVDFSDNFDGSLQEPITLPARLPNILLNGSTGIAVGMATDIPPHNLSEIVKACIALLKNANLSIEQLTDIVPAPDLPTRAQIITDRRDLVAMYTTGKGSYKMRAAYHTDPKDPQSIIIDSLPYQVSGNKIIEQIAKLMQDKKAIGQLITDVHDESDHQNPCRIVLTVKKNKVDTDQLMAYLFAATDLENSYRVNMNMIGTDNKPAVKNLKSILNEWLNFRKNTVIRRLKFRLQKITARLHIIAGLLVVYVNINEVIAIIHQEDAPKTALMRRFSLSSTQADAILDIKLRQLAKLEESALNREQTQLLQEQSTIDDQLSHESSLNRLLISELQADLKRYGDARQSPLVSIDDAPSSTVLDFIPSEPITVIVSQAGWIRATKGHDADPQTMNYRTGDGYFLHAQGNSTDKVYLLDSQGRSYRLDAHTLPSARGQGEPLTSLLKPTEQARFIGLLMDNGKGAQMLLASTRGYGFIVQAADLDTNQKAGKAVLNLGNQHSNNNQPLATLIDANDTHIAAISNAGFLLIFPLNSLPRLKKGKGNKLIALKNGEMLTAISTLALSDTLQLSAGKRTLTLRPNALSDFIGVRTGRGTQLPKGLQKVTAMQKLL